MDAELYDQQEREPTAQEALRNYVAWMLKVTTIEEVERLSGLPRPRIYWIRRRGFASKKDIAALHRVAAVLNQSTKELEHDDAW